MQRFEWPYGLAAAPVSAGLLVGFAGSGDSGNAGNKVSTAINSISGVVIDGYIEGAEVCLAPNFNRVCDVEDPHATTDTNGCV
jgi:hypothetical protein